MSTPNVSADPALADQYRSWLEAGELRLQQCDACGTWRHIPRVWCPRCSSDQWHWQRPSGHGTLYSWTTTERQLHPDYPAPYTVAMVELDEGPRILAQLSDVPANRLRPGLELQAVVASDGQLRFAAN